MVRLVLLALRRYLFTFASFFDRSVVKSLSRRHAFCKESLVVSGKEWLTWQPGWSELSFDAVFFYAYLRIFPLLKQTNSGNHAWQKAVVVVGAGNNGSLGKILN